MDQSVIWIPKCTEGGRSPISEIFLNFATFFTPPRKRNLLWMAWRANSDSCFWWFFWGCTNFLLWWWGGGEDGSKILAFSADPLGRLPYCEMYESTWYFIHNMKIELVRLNIYTDVVSPLLVLPFLWFWGILYNCLEGSFSVPESCQIYKILFNHFSYSHIPLSEINVQT